MLIQVLTSIATSLLVTLAFQINFVKKARKNNEPKDKA